MGEAEAGQIAASSNEVTVIFSTDCWEYTNIGSLTSGPEFVEAYTKMGLDSPKKSQYSYSIHFGLNVLPI